MSRFKNFLRKKVGCILRRVYFSRSSIQTEAYLIIIAGGRFFDTCATAKMLMRATRKTSRRREVLRQSLMIDYNCRDDSRARTRASAIRVICRLRPASRNRGMPALVSATRVSIVCDEPENLLISIRAPSGIGA